MCFKDGMFFFFLKIGEVCPYFTSPKYIVAFTTIHIQYAMMGI